MEKTIDSIRAYSEPGKRAQQSSCMTLRVLLMGSGSSHLWFMVSIEKKTASKTFQIYFSQDFFFQPGREFLIN